MKATLRERLEALGDAFWLRPALLVAAALVLSQFAIAAEAAGWTGASLPGGWIFQGGEAGARSMLGAIAGSTIGVAGTTFSITVAALSLASGQMGPRLLRNFVRDGGNQVALGIFLGTFVYALLVLRTVRATDEGAFVPHLAVTGAIALAMLCVGTLVWFVHHVAAGINVETVIGLVHAELRDTVERMVAQEPSPDPPPAPRGGAPACIPGGGYLRALDEEALADWAAEAGATLVLRARPGDHLFPGVPVAEVLPPEAAADAAPRLEAAMTLGDRRAAAQDPEFAVRQLAEIAVRALSPGINDPFTAIAVLDRFGDALCRLANRPLRSPVLWRQGRAVLFRRAVDHDGLLDAMFHMIRQDGRGSAAALIRLMEVLGAVLAVERDPARRVGLRRHAALALEAGRAGLAEPAAVRDLEAAFAQLDPGPASA